MSLVRIDTDPVAFLLSHIEEGIRVHGLSEEIGPYLYHLTMNPPPLDKSIILEFSVATTPEQYRHIGDKCLIIAGMFPESVVMTLYLYEMFGVSAYHQTGTNVSKEISRNFSKVSSILKGIKSGENPDFDNVVRIF